MPPLYFDAAATTPMDPAVAGVMLPILTSVHGNPSSAHWAGREARMLVDRAREQVASLLSTGPATVVFTSGATESNNLALLGTTAAAGDRNELITTAIEHPSVLAVLRALEARGFTLRVLSVDEFGQVNLDELRAALGDQTLLLSLQAANNETGVVQDVGAVGELAHEAGALLHVDASQLMAWGQWPSSWESDLITVSGHKMHGPQGVGALIVSRSVRRTLEPLLLGGGQEAGLRSGTNNVAGIVGLGEAASLSEHSGHCAASAVGALRNYLADALATNLPDAQDNAAGAARRLPGVLNICLALEGHMIDSEAVLAQMPSVAASTGSACSAGAPGPSPVLLAMGRTHEQALSSLRLSLSRMTTAEEVDEVVPLITEAVRTVRAWSQDGSRQLEAEAVMVR